MEGAELVLDFSLDPFLAPDVELDPFFSAGAGVDPESLDDPLAELFAF
ncbi:MAG TPA: hypothetical protein VE441_00230 [Mycobacterium sp.]|nr:hypothetical protein [Mycobacterium sp.]